MTDLLQAEKLRYRQKEDSHVMTEAEIGVMLSKEYAGLPEAGRGEEGSFPKLSRGLMALSTLIWTSYSQNCKTILFQASPFVLLSSSRKPTQFYESSKLLAPASGLTFPLPLYPALRFKAALLSLVLVFIITIINDHPKFYETQVHRSQPIPVYSNQLEFC